MYGVHTTVCCEDVYAVHATVGGCMCLWTLEMSHVIFMCFFKPDFLRQSLSLNLEIIEVSGTFLSLPLYC